MNEWLKQQVIYRRGTQHRIRFERWDGGADTNVTGTQNL